MPTYQIPCPDGSDRNCQGTVDVFIEKEHLSENEVSTYIYDHNIDVDVCGACGSDYTRDNEGSIIDD